MARQARRISLSPDEQDRLQKIANARFAPQALAFRARIILRCASPNKPTNLQVADELHCDPDTVARLLELIRADGRTVIAGCGFVVDYLHRNPEFSDLTA